MMRPRIALALLLALIGSGIDVMAEQTKSGRFTVGLSPTVSVPVVDPSGTLGGGFGVQLSAWYALGTLPLATDFALSYKFNASGEAALATIAGGLGLLFRTRVLPRLSMHVGGRLSYGYSALTLMSGHVGYGGALGWAGHVGLSAEVTDTWSAILDVEASAHMNTFVGLSAGVGAAFALPSRGEITGSRSVPRTEQVQPELPRESNSAPSVGTDVNGRETAENVRQDLLLLNAGFNLVFPVFYRYYDEHPVGTATFTNNSALTISGIELVVNIPRFMDVPQKQTVVDQLGPGEELQIPLTILFNDGLLGVTEGTRVACEFRVSYQVGGTTRDYTVDTALNIADRNAMTWDDDRKAASFVTAKEPTVLAFARNVASVVRSSGYLGVNSSLRTGMAMLEAMAAYGINYVIDPTTPHSELSEQSLSVDFLQFPRQTFQFKAGDCDDLSILYVSNLEAVGIECAFLTIPGHLYSAFSTGLSMQQARRAFSTTADMINHDGIAWIPVETTLLQEGFLEAWRVGARQWREYQDRDQAQLIPIEAAWRVYEPVGFDLQTTAPVDLPSPGATAAAYLRELQRFIAREIGPQVAEMEARIEATGDPRQMNRLGVLYARYDLFAEAEQKFLEVLAVGPEAYAYLNLGNIEFLRGDHTAAAALFAQAGHLLPEDPAVLLAIAKANHELENHSVAGQAFSRLQEIAPELAADFEYLQFQGNETVRASNASGQRSTVVWGLHMP